MAAIQQSNLHMPGLFASFYAARKLAGRRTQSRFSTTDLLAGRLKVVVTLACDAAVVEADPQHITPAPPSSGQAPSNFFAACT